MVMSAQRHDDVRAETYGRASFYVAELREGVFDEWLAELLISSSRTSAVKRRSMVPCELGTDSHGCSRI